MLDQTTYKKKNKDLTTTRTEKQIKAILLIIGKRKNLLTIS